MIRHISLMTDFGLRDGYPGVMEAVIYKIAPQAKITNLTHLVPPQNIREGSLIWERSSLYFPDHSIHVGVVDPGVGTQRRAIAAQLGQQFFVCPDNGLISRALQRAEQQGAPARFIHLNRPQYWLPDVSNVFHGRDIFAPVAAHLASGVDLLDLGEPITDPHRLEIEVPQPIPGGWRGQITSIDHFGNAATNFTSEHLKGKQRPVFRIGAYQIRGLTRTFGDCPPGSTIALFDSDGTIAIAIVQGNAAQGLNINVGDPLDVIEEE